MWILLCEMWIHMALLQCIFPDCKNSAKEEIKTKEWWMWSVTHSNMKREDKLNERLNRLKAEGVILACQRRSVSS